MFRRLVFLVVLVFSWSFLACAEKPIAPPAEPARPAPPVEAKPLPVEEAAWSEVIKKAQKEGLVTVYSSTTIEPERKAIEAAIKARYGIRVEWVTGRGAELRERIAMEQRAGTYIADFNEGGPTSIQLSKAAGDLLEAEVPALGEKGVWKVDPHNMDAEKKIIAYSQYPPPYLAPWANTRLVRPEEEPRSWSDLLHPRWKGKMAMDDPTLAGPGHIGFATNRDYIMGLDYWKKMAEQDIKIVRGYRDEFDILARGEFAIMINPVSTYGFPFLDAGAPIKPLSIKEGVGNILLVLALIKNPPHPNAAKLLMDWMLSKEGQTTISRARYGGEIRLDVPSITHPKLGDFKVDKIVYPTLEDLTVKARESWEMAAKLFKK